MTTYTCLNCGAPIYADDAGLFGPDSEVCAECRSRLRIAPPNDDGEKRRAAEARGAAEEWHHNNAMRDALGDHGQG